MNTQDQIAPVSVMEQGYIPEKVLYVVKPILRVRNGVPVSHETNFKFLDTHDSIGLPMVADRRQKRFVNPFKSEAEIQWLEKKLNKSINVYDGDNIFLSNFRVILKKTKTDEEHLTLWTDNPNELLSIRILQANRDLICADNTLRITDIPITCRYTLGPIDKEFELELSQADVQKDIWAFYSSAENDPRKLGAFIKLLKPSAIIDYTDLKWLRKETYNLIQADPEKAYVVISDKDMQYKVFWENATETRAVVFTDEGWCIYGSSIPFAINKHQAIEYFKNPKNSEEVNIIKARIKQVRDSAV
jgi:hypothetical protein